MQIEIICTGDEVVSGKIVNGNFATISRKLGDAGLAVRWGTTVGDDRETLLAAFREAGARADLVIVNGGLGPTVDDLSQEIAARAAGVGLALNEAWLARMEAFFQGRRRTMPANNRKQAMLPEGAEVLDNPIGTACGFAITIGKARFFFTPGVPRELERMLDGEILPRILALTGSPGIIHLKRFHSYGLGESHVDSLLDGLEALDPDGSVKLGFRAHYPQLETKLTARAADAAEVRRKLTPFEAEIRRRLGNFIVAEDDATHEGVVLGVLAERGGSLVTIETFTGGALVARLSSAAASRPAGGGAVFRRGLVAQDSGELGALVGLTGAAIAAPYTGEAAIRVAEAARQQASATHALAVLIDLDAGAERFDLGASIHIGIAAGDQRVHRRARILGGRDWVRSGAAELALDVLRRHLFGLPIDERSDFELAEAARGVTATGGTR
jgi:nicotinamide-nucleotide amidase